MIRVLYQKNNKNRFNLFLKLNTSRIQLSDNSYNPFNLIKIYFYKVVFVNKYKKKNEDINNWIIENML